jgi:hypothetical protein
MLFKVSIFGLAQRRERKRYRYMDERRANVEKGNIGVTIGQWEQMTKVKQRAL